VTFIFIPITFIIIGWWCLALYAIWCLGSAIPSIALAMRRMHDVGKSGVYVFIPIYDLILAATPGEIGKNQYGSNPNQ
jgi:uncharacterized membrane protein YhaH (DUF805 family)